MSMTEQQVMVTTLAAIQGITLYATLMPKPIEVRDSHCNQMARQVHLPMAIAATFTFGLAIIISILVNHRAPLIVAGGTVAGVALVYELLLRSQP